MKKLLLLLACLAGLTTSYLQEPGKLNFKRGFEIGLGFGEIPYKGSFKPSLTFGYHLSEKLYFGLIYQLKDHIRRDNSSFNAQSSQLEGLLSAREEVAGRFLLQGRYKPFKNGPYLSFGWVYNGRDQEEIKFDDRSRLINGQEYEGAIQVTQTRPGGGGLALGIGYQQHLGNGFSIQAEWTPAWFTPIPTPEYQFSGTADLSVDARTYLSEKMTDRFQSTVTNRYKVFHIGFAKKL